MSCLKVFVRGTASARTKGARRNAYEFQNLNQTPRAASLSSQRACCGVYCEPDPIPRQRTDSTCETVWLSTADEAEGIRLKRPPREFSYREHTGPCIIRALSPLSEDRLWILYNEGLPISEFSCMKLFDAQGQVLTTVQKVRCSGLITVADDMTLGWYAGESTVQLITSDGRLSTQDIGIQVVSFVSCAAKDKYYLITGWHGKLSRVEFTLADDGQTDTTEFQHGASLPESSRHPQLTNRLKCSEAEVVFEETPSGCLEHVSSGGQYFAFIEYYCSEVKIYTPCDKHGFLLVSSYTPANKVYGTRFWNIGGQERLLVNVGFKAVHVVDYTNGRLLGCLDADLLEQNWFRLLETDLDQHLWIAFENAGKVAEIDL